MLDWTQRDLAEKAGVAESTIRNIEKNNTTVQNETLNKITNAFRLEGIEFISGGVRETETIVTLEGSQGFSNFLDDVYNTAIRYGTPENPCQVFLNNVVHANWVRWMGQEKWSEHTHRMTKDKDLMDVRIIVVEGDYNFPAAAYSKYKWVPQDQFRDKAFYSYHDKLAFLDFRDDNVYITIMRNKDFAEGYRTLFLTTWEHGASDIT